MVFVAIGQHSSVVLCAQVGLDTLSICRATSVDIFTSLVAADERDSLDTWFIDDKVYSWSGSVNNVDNSWWEASLFSKLGQDHTSTWITFGRLDNEGVASHGSNWYRPEGDHSWEV